MTFRIFLLIIPATYVIIIFRTYNLYNNKNRDYICMNALYALRKDELYDI